MKNYEEAVGIGVSKKTSVSDMLSAGFQVTSLSVYQLFYLLFSLSY